MNIYFPTELKKNRADKKAGAPNESQDVPIRESPANDIFISCFLDKKCHIRNVTCGLSIATSLLAHKKQKNKYKGSAKTYHTPTLFVNYFLVSVSNFFDVIR